MGDDLISRAVETSELDPVFENALRRAIDGENLREPEIESLMQAKGDEFSMLIMAADGLRRRTVGDTVTYVVNRNLNFTNVCDCRCAFCGFARDGEDPDAYLLSTDRIREKVRQAREFGVTEICAQGGINPEVDLDYMLGVLETIREEMPDVHIHAFSPMEIDHASELSGLPVKETLQVLMEGGLNSMPGTAAEILVDEVRDIICPNKISSDRWEDIVRTAHGLGLPTTSTMMYGTVESTYHRASHLKRIREIQERSGGFTEFVPLPFVHGNSPISMIVPWKPSGIDDLRMIAVSRLVLGPVIPNIQVSWVKMGIKLAQIGLACGANDFGGTLIEENISSCAGQTPGSLLKPQEIERLILELDRTPAQRSTTYELL
jgi:FO synthase subunit 2